MGGETEETKQPLVSRESPPEYLSTYLRAIKCELIQLINLFSGLVIASN